MKKERHIVNALKELKRNEYGVEYNKKHAVKD